ncbi:oligosaccharide flippase family protein [Pseudomonadales bacterium]|nr:oligosaccharide flippase family protein [Pseudomonadales bacterium]
MESNINVLKDSFFNIFTVIIKLLSPLIVIPILLENFGISIYGGYVAFLAFSALICVFTDMGFEMYYSKEVSLHRDNDIVLSSLLSVFLYVKIIVSVTLLLISLIVLDTLIFEIKNLFLWLVFITLANSFQLSSFFSGLGKYKQLSAITTVSKSFYIALILSSDYSEYGKEKILFYHGAALWGSFIAQLVYLHCQKKVKYSLPSINLLIKTVKAAFGFYFSRLFLNIYNQSSTYIVSLFLSSDLVGIYSVAFQLYKVGQAFIGAIAKVLYTTVVRTKKFILVKKATIIVTCIYISIIPVVLFFGESIIEFFLDFESPMIFDVALIFFVSLFFVMLSSFWGYPIMVPLGKDKLAHYGIFFGSATYYLFFATMVLFKLESIYTFALCVLISDFSGACFRLYFAKKTLNKKYFFANN